MGGPLLQTGHCDFVELDGCGFKSSVPDREGRTSSVDSSDKFDESFILLGLGVVSVHESHLLGLKSLSSKCLVFHPL